MARESAHQLGTPLSSLAVGSSCSRTSAEDDAHATRRRRTCAPISSGSIAWRTASSASAASRGASRSTSPSSSTASRRISARASRRSRTRSRSTSRRAGRRRRRARRCGAARVGARGARQERGRRARRPRRPHHARRASRAAEGGARLRVADDGPGIPRELRGRIFEPGFSTKTSGWGIGLSLARRIVEENHGGTLALAAVGPRRDVRDYLTLMARLRLTIRCSRGLNPAQREAVLHVDGPLLVLAGAGSGKTRVLTTRIARLIEHQGVDPSRILAGHVHQQGRRRDERAHRAPARPRSRRACGSARSTPSARACCARRRTSSVARRVHDLRSGRHASASIKRVMERHRLNVEAVHAARRARRDLRREERARHAGRVRERSRWIRSRKAVAAGLSTISARRCAWRTQSTSTTCSCCPCACSRENPEELEKYRRKFKYILVDEYQDTNRAQYQFVKLLAGGHGNVCVVGDDDQSIYGWRGADIRNILDFNKDFPDAHVVRLEENYRSTPEVLDLANVVISANTGRHGQDAAPHASQRRARHGRRAASTSATRPTSSSRSSSRVARSRRRSRCATSRSSIARTRRAARSRRRCASARSRIASSARCASTTGARSAIS